MRPSAIVLSGGPSSVWAEDAPGIDDEILSMEVPILGICYGLQLLAQRLGGRVVEAPEREYGRARVKHLAGAGSLLVTGCSVHSTLATALMSG